MISITLGFALKLFVLCFIQNMAFTFVSRSRNSGNPGRHAIAAVFSNSIWFLVNFFLLFPEIMKSLEYGSLGYRLTIMAIYTAGTVCGSVFMMKVNLGHYGDIPFLTEHKKDQVGAR